MSLITLFSSGSSGTGSAVELSSTRKTDLVIQVAPGSYTSVQIFGSVAGVAPAALPGYSITGSVTSPTITTFTPGMYVIPNAGGLVVEARVALSGGSGSVFAKALTG